MTYEVRQKMALHSTGKRVPTSIKTNANPILVLDMINDGT